LTSKSLSASHGFICRCEQGNAYPELSVDSAPFNIFSAVTSEIARSGSSADGSAATRYIFSKAALAISRSSPGRGGSSVV